MPGVEVVFVLLCIDAGVQGFISGSPRALHALHARCFHVCGDQDLRIQMHRDWNLIITHFDPDHAGLSVQTPFRFIIYRT
jgi:hypothetical protein